MSKSLLYKVTLYLSTGQEVDVYLKCRSDDICRDAIASVEDDMENGIVGRLGRLHITDAKIAAYKFERYRMIAAFFERMLGT